MERRVAERMSRIFETLETRYGSWDRARCFAIELHLNRANHYGALLSAISAILFEAGIDGSDPSCQFDEAEYDWIITNAKTDPRVVKNLLILGAVGVDFGHK